MIEQNYFKQFLTFYTRDMLHNFVRKFFLFILNGKKTLFCFLLFRIKSLCRRFGFIYKQIAQVSYTSNSAILAIDDMHG